MNTYLISYDLNKSGKDYSALNARIKELFGTWWNHLTTTWIVKTNYTAKQIRDDLQQYVDSNDELLVVGLSGEGAWHGFSERGSKWLKDNL